MSEVRRGHRRVRAGIAPLRQLGLTPGGFRGFYDKWEDGVWHHGQLSGSGSHLVFHSSGWYVNMRANPPTPVTPTRRSVEEGV